jgi:Ca2+-binding RTX toxin-like protein
MTSTGWRRVLRRNVRRQWHGSARTPFELLEVRLPPHAGHGPHVAAALAEAGLHHESLGHPADPAWHQIAPQGTDPLDYFGMLGEYDYQYAQQVNHEAFDRWLLENYPVSGGGQPIQPLEPVPAAAPELTGQWGSVINWPHVAVHSHLLPNGKVMTWPYSDDPRLWDPITNTFTSLTPAGYNVFCSGHSFLADGRLLVTGGNAPAPAGGFVGWPDASIYDPVTNSWSAVPDMNAGRWYPTNTTLPNGEVVVSSGLIDSFIGVNPLTQVWQPGNEWRDLSAAQLQLPLYPWMHVAPNGQVFNAGPNQNTRYLSAPTSGAWSNVANRTFGFRDYGTGVIYDGGKVLAVGGADPPTATAEVIDLNAATPTWRSVSSMSIARRQINATVLPDGKVLVTGGSSASGFNNESGAVLYAEMWDPVSETWSTMANYTQYRGYHSTAVLLPDGRVLSAGGDGHPTGEVFSPPYLFAGARPTIASAPATANYGQTIFVQTPDASDISRVSLIRLTSVTHAFNMDQRINFPTFAQTAGGLNVTLPSNANLLPQGYYMLFIVNGSGVPSVASMLRVASNVPVGAIGTPSAGTFYNAGDTINYSGTATDSEDGVLAASRFTWQVDFYHDGHVHPFVPPTSGASGGSFTIPTIGETSTNVFYRIWLTVKDSNGLTHSTFRDLAPRTSTLTFNTNPGGLQLRLDNQPIVTPSSMPSVVGMNRVLEAVNQLTGGTYYAFQSWSDGGTGTHTIATPAIDTSYTATFQLNAPYQQDPGSQGLLSIEAEHFFHKVDNSGHRWTPNGTAGHSGDSAMEATPNNGALINTGYAATSPRMDFRVNFAKTGTHYVWVRGIAMNGADDSLHVGLDEAEISTSDRISNFVLGPNWSWTNGTMDGPVATLDVATTGYHTLNVWMREDGFILDKLVLTTDPSFRPTGTGIAESIRVPKITVSDVSVTEGNPGTGTAALFTVSLGSASSVPVTLYYSTADGTATAGVDYTAAPVTLLRFDVGQTTKRIKVKVMGDSDPEPDENFLLNLANVGNGLLVDSQAVGVIVNDDLARQYDIRMLSATADGVATLELSYEVLFETVPAFEIGLYRSSDALFGGDVLLGTVAIAAEGDRTVGVHTKRIPIGSDTGALPLPGAGASEVNTDYYVLAVADPLNGVIEADAEPFNEDNTAAFVGVYHPAGGYLFVHGSGAADTITVSGAITLNINGTSYSYSAKDISGLRVRSHDGADVIKGTAVSPMFVYAGAGSDTVSGGPGNDVLDGGPDNDRLSGGPGNDIILGGPGDDNLNGKAGDDTVDGGPGTDSWTFEGTKDSDFIEVNWDAALGQLIGTRRPTAGGAVAETDRASLIERLIVLTLEAADRIDLSFLSAAKITAAGLTDPTTVDGGAGADTVLGSAGRDSISGGTGADNDNLSGGAGNDTVDGGAGNDTLVGGDDDDSLLGGDGNDSLDGGAGIDTLNGGLGTDTGTNGEVVSNCEF